MTAIPNIRLKRAFLAFTLLFSLIYVAAAEEKPCTTHDKGRLYDLNPLKSSKDYHVLGDGNDIFPINVCQGVKTETFGIKDDIPATDIAAFVRRGHGDFVIGKVNTTLDVYNDRARLVLSDGSKCKSKDNEALDMRASTIIDFVCDISVLGPGQPRLLARLPPGDDKIACAFVIEWRTHFACPISENGVIWSIFVVLAVVFLVLLMTYTVLGTLYNRYVLQLRGFDQIPQFSIESMKYHAGEALDWIKDVAASQNIGRPGGFFGVPNDPRAPNPFSHQAQSGGINVLDEEASTGFIRPQANRGPSTPRKETNPISHQTQVNAANQRIQSLSFSQSPSRPQPLGASARTKLEVREATNEEKEFMLGDEDDYDDDASELDFVKPIPSGSNDPRFTAATRQPSTPQPTQPPPLGNSNNTGTDQRANLDSTLSAAPRGKEPESGNGKASQS